MNMSQSSGSSCQQLVTSNISSGSSSKKLTAVNMTSGGKSSSDGGMVENDGNDSAENEEEITPEIILSIVWHENKLGAAFYDVDSCNLCLIPDHIETEPAFTVLKLILRQAEPAYIVTSSRTDEKLLNFLKENYLPQVNTETSSSTGGSTNSRPSLHLLPKLEFAYEVCKHRLQNLNPPNIPKHMNDVEKQMYFSSWIDFTNTCMVQAAGGLLKYIEKGHLGLVLDDDTLCPVNSIAISSLKHVLNIDDNTYKALQIFQGERHPSVYKSSFGSKEGLSLFGICNKCKSAIGKKELRRWFLLPTTDIAVISQRKAAVKYFSSSRNSEITSTLRNSLKQIKFVSRIFSRMKTSQASVNDWQALYKTVYHAIVIREICVAHRSALEMFNKIATTFSSDLFRIVSLLNKIIDFDEFTKQNHFTVKYGVDSELDQMKRRYHGLPDFMTQVACEELQNLDNDIQQCRVIYLPQLGYLLAVPMTEQMRETKDYTIEGLRFMFVVNDTVHYKSAKTRELDATLGDTLCDIYDKETQIMHKLQNVILEMKDLVFPVMDLCAKLDCLIALACAANEYSWTEPEIVKDDSLIIIKGRHPLQEMCVAAFVANDTLSGGSESKIKVLTGPNSSGKSVYLKQVALIVYMAHIGSFVPAGQAKIPIVSNIFAYTHSTESVSVNLSSFFISLNQISLPLNNATSNSVVVVDEFGKDTEHHSGIALSVAILKFWAAKGPSSPHIFLATHYLSLNTFFTNSPFIKFQTMDIIQNEDLVFLYQIVDGIAASSHAVNTALLAGLPQHIVRRSLEISEALKKKQPIPVNKSLGVNQKLKVYRSIYERFSELDVESDDVLDFIKFVKDSVASLNTPNVNT